MTLKRPFGKLRLLATDYNVTDNAKPITDVKSVTVEYTSEIPNQFDAVDGIFDNYATVASYTYNWTVDGSNYVNYYKMTDGAMPLFADYIPANGEGQDNPTTFRVTVTYGNGETYSRTFNDIPVRRNALTTLKGAFFTANSEIKVEVKDAFEGQPENINFVSVSTATQLQDAINNGGDGETIILTDDIVLTEPLVFGVNSGNPAPTRSGATNSFVLNLNGNDIIGTDTSTASYGLITIKNGAELTIEGNGTISLTAEQNRYWNAYSSVISNQPGGKLIVNGGTIQHLGGTDMAYAIDNLTNGKGTYAETIINGGTIKSTYRAIRQFLNGVEAQNILTVNGGTIESTEGNKAIWMQDPSKNANTGTLFVGADAKLKGNVYLTVTEGSTEWPVKAFITIDALKDGSKVELNDAAKAKVDGQITFAVSGADQLVGALENKHNVYLMNDIKIDPATMSNAYGTTGINVKYGQTIDGGGHTLNIQGAGGTWDSGINTTGGIIRNLTVTGSFRGIFINHNSSYSEKVVLENVTITGTTYTISCDQGLYQGIEATNCTFNGWTSYAATLGSAKFLNCSFGEGNGYKYCRPYCSTEFVECTFCPGYAVDTTQAEVKFTDCTWEE